MTTKTVIEETVEIEVEVETQQQIEVFGQEVAKLEEQAKTIVVTDDVTEEVSLIFINGCKKTHGDIESYREGKVRPHNAYVAKINSGVKPFKDVLSRLVSATDALRSQYLTRKQRMIDEENRRRIAEAEKERLEKERKEREAREEAARVLAEAERIAKEQQDREYQEEMNRLAADKKIRDDLDTARAAKESGDTEAEAEAMRKAAQAKVDEEARVKQVEADRVAAEAEQARLAKQAVTLEARADMAATAASLVAPEIAVNCSMGARTLANGGRVGTREVEEPYFTNGMPIYADPIKRKYAEYYRDDARISQELPDRYFSLDLAKVVRDLKNGVPVPGMALRSKHTTVSRKS